MGLLWDAFQKTATAAPAPPGGSPAPTAAPAMPALPAPPNTAAPAPPQTPSLAWHPAWTPPPGWKSPENPDGWVRPKKEDKRRELFLWHQWKESGKDPVVAEPLVKSIRPMVYTYGVKGWVNRVPIAKSVLEQNALGLAMAGLDTYDPTRGQLNTHVVNQLKSMNRFVRQRQNFSRIIEERLRHIGTVERARSRLQEKLEREPTIIELADEAKIPPDTVRQLLQEKREDLVASGAKEDPFLDETHPDRLTLQLLRYSLTPDEEVVFDYLTGQGGRPLVTKPGEIAKREGWGGSKVSQLKKSIMKKIERAR